MVSNVSIRWGLYSDSCKIFFNTMSSHPMPSETLDPWERPSQLQLFTGRPYLTRQLIHEGPVSVDDEATASMFVILYAILSVEPDTTGFSECW